jgi:hypothetical protein
MLMVSPLKSGQHFVCSYARRNAFARGSENNADGSNPYGSGKMDAVRLSPNIFSVTTTSKSRQTIFRTIRYSLYGMMVYHLVARSLEALRPGARPDRRLLIMWTFCPAFRARRMNSGPQVVLFSVGAT